MDAFDAAPTDMDVVIDRAGVPGTRWAGARCFGVRTDAAWVLTVIRCFKQLEPDFPATLQPGVSSILPEYALGILSAIGKRARCRGLSAELGGIRGAILSAVTTLLELVKGFPAG
jgi:hypothetical protein